MKPTTKPAPRTARPARQSEGRKARNVQPNHNTRENPYRLPCGRLVVGPGDV